MRKLVFETYACERCGTNYETAAQALACQAAGAPIAAYAKGQSVRFRPQAGPEVLEPEVFMVEASFCTLYRPARLSAGGDDISPAHTTSYALQNHIGTVAFIAEHQLMPAGSPSSP